MLDATPFLFMDLIAAVQRIPIRPRFRVAVQLFFQKAPCLAGLSLLLYYIGQYSKYGTADVWMPKLHITTGSSVPIYRQIVDQMRQAVGSGKLSTGEAVLSVRALARELLINPNTVAKAYSALVRDGLLESRQGRGYFVAERREIYTRKERHRRLEEAMDPFLAEALTLGFEPEQIMEQINKRLTKMSRK